MDRYEFAVMNVITLYFFKCPHKMENIYTYFTFYASLLSESADEIDLRAVTVDLKL